MRASDGSSGSLPSGTVTLMFTDIEGSTELWDRLGDGFAPVLGTHNVILRDAVAAHNGVVVKTEGDAFMMAFASPVDAVRCAISAQRDLQRQQWPGPVGELRVRMGLHTGAPLLRDGDYLGPPVNRAARICDAGHGQQILVSGVTARLVQEQRLEGLELRDLGHHQLPGLSEPTRLYQVCHPDLPRGAFPPVRTLDHHPHNLPQALTSFVGRDAELRDVERLLAHEDARLLTLTGPGGSGKTRLALAVAGQQLSRFPDGVWFVDLSAVRDTDHLITEIGTSVGMKFQPTEAPLGQVKRHFERKRALLVLDNFEQVADAAEAVVDLLGNSEHLRCLITSRERLRVSGEHEYRVPPLALPPDTDALDALSRCDSVTLFLERAHQVAAGFGLTQQVARTVAQICHRVDGIPLAIELAAARVRTMTPSEILSRLERSFDILGSRDRDVPERQRTLANVLDWSYGLLEPEEQEGLAALAVFQGGCTLKAAEEVLTTSAVLDLLESLAGKSLLVTEEVSGQTRYLLFPAATHEYAARRLSESESHVDVRARHAAYYLQLAEAHKDMLIGPDQERAVAALTPEMDNIRAGRTWLASRRDGQGAARYALATSRLMRLLGLWEERREWATQAKSVLGEDAPPQVVGDLLHTLALAHHDLCDYDAARGTYEDSLAIRRRLDNREGMAATLNNLGIIAWARGDYEEARARYQESLDIQRELDDQRGVGASLSNLGSIACTVGDYKEAERLYQESLEKYRRLGESSSIANVLNNLGDLARRRGAYDEAEQHHRESLLLRQSLGDQSGIAASLNNLAEVACRQGDLTSAEQLCSDSLRMRRDLGDQRGVAMSLSTLGTIASASGRHQEGEAHLHKSLEAAHKLGERAMVALVLWELGHLYRAAGIRERAAELLACARAQLAEIGVRRGYEVSEINRELRELEKALGEAELAAAMIRGEAMSLDSAVQEVMHQDPLCQSGAGHRRRER